MLFTAITDRDFDAYLENKWQSNVFNRERLEVKQKLQALGRLLSPHLTASDGSLLQFEVSAEHPAVWNQHRVQNQHLFFARNQEARRELDLIISKQRSIAALIEDPSPLRNHIFLSVMIDQAGIEVALKLHADASVDRENLQRKCQEFFSREKLLVLIRELPASFRVGLHGATELPVATLDDDALSRLIQELPGSSTWLEIRSLHPRDDDTVRDPSFLEVVRQELIHLLPLYAFISWSRENDLVSMKDTLKKKEISQKSGGLSKNDSVRVTRGMFTGKTGIVQEMDAKGVARVLLGTMVVKISGGDLTKI